MKHILKVLLSFALFALLVGCKGETVAPVAQEPGPHELMLHNSIYYWRTTFAIDSAEQSFIEQHKIDRIYLRLFDVAREKNYDTESAEIVPIATTRFESPRPQGCEIVPVVYITIDALREMYGSEADYAELIVERIKAMCSYNNCGVIKEVQLDCDWTQTTKDVYSRLCHEVKYLLSADDISLSITVRLHQLQEPPPPADRGVLMLYNTGALKNPDTRNSILDIDDVKPYIKSRPYPLPLSYSYPAFGWGVKFEDGNFVAIVSEQDTVPADTEYIRYERASYDEIAAVKELVESKIGKPQGGNILYHLDCKQLKNYSDDEISRILAY